MALTDLENIIELRNLASIFKQNSLYLVGGSVRNALIGLPIGDLDIASVLHIDDVKNLLKNSAYKVSAEYPRTGTLVITRENFKAEYTTFREDSYPVGSGIHMPDSVKFTDDITKDAKRRDFTINAIYYDIVNRVIKDPVNGVNDINIRTLKCVDNPDRVMSQDALRIMRLLRFRAELGFDIEPNTYNTIKTYAERLNEISRERVTEELLKTLSAEQKYPRFLEGNIQKALLQCLLEYQRNGILNIVLGIDSISDKVKYIESENDIIQRLTAIYCDIQNYSTVMKKIKLPNNLIHRVSVAIKAYQADKNDITEFIINHIEGYNSARPIMDETFTRAVDCCVNSGVPLKISELKINGNDAKKLGFEGKQIAAALKYVLKRSIKLRLTNKDEQMEELKKYE